MMEELLGMPSPPTSKPEYKRPHKRPSARLVSRSRLHVQLLLDKESKAEVEIPCGRDSAIHAPYRPLGSMEPIFAIRNQRIRRLPSSQSESRSSTPNRLVQTNIKRSGETNTSNTQDVRRNASTTKETTTLPAESTKFEEEEKNTNFCSIAGSTARVCSKLSNNRNQSLGFAEIQQSVAQSQARMRSVKAGAHFSSLLTPPSVEARIEFATIHAKAIVKKSVETKSALRKRMKQFKKQFPVNKENGKGSIKLSSFRLRESVHVPNHSMQFDEQVDFATRLEKHIDHLGSKLNQATRHKPVPRDPKGNSMKGSPAGEICEDKTKQHQTVRTIPPHEAKTNEDLKPEHTFDLSELCHTTEFTAAIPQGLLDLHGYRILHLTEREWKKLVLDLEAISRLMARQVAEQASDCTKTTQVRGGNSTVISRGNIAQEQQLTKVSRLSKVRLSVKVVNLLKENNISETQRTSSKLQGRSRQRKRLPSYVVLNQEVVHDEISALSSAAAAAAPHVTSAGITLSRSGVSKRPGKEAPEVSFSLTGPLQTDKVRMYYVAATEAVRVGKDGNFGEMTAKEVFLLYALNVRANGGRLTAIAARIPSRSKLNETDPYHELHRFLASIVSPLTAVQARAQYVNIVSRFVELKPILEAMRKGNGYGVPQKQVNESEGCENSLKARQTVLDRRYKSNVQTWEQLRSKSQFSVQSIINCCVAFHTTKENARNQLIGTIALVDHQRADNVRQKSSAFDLSLRGDIQSKVETSTTFITNSKLCLEEEEEQQVDSAKNYNIERTNLDTMRLIAEHLKSEQAKLNLSRCSWFAYLVKRRNETGHPPTSPELKFLAILKWLIMNGWKLNKELLCFILKDGLDPVDLRSPLLQRLIAFVRTEVVGMTISEHVEMLKTNNLHIPQSVLDQLSAQDEEARQEAAGISKKGQTSKSSGAFFSMRAAHMAMKWRRRTNLQK